MEALLWLVRPLLPWAAAGAAIVALVLVVRWACAWPEETDQEWIDRQW